MKEIKAYIRPQVLESVIRELENAGARDLTVIRVDAIGAMSAEDEEHRHLIRKYDTEYSVILCALEQRSQKEAAELLGITPKTVELRIYRAKKKLRDLMAKSQRRSD